MIINPYAFNSYDADALAFITASGITDATQKSAINTLVLDLKSYSIWTKLKVIYPFVGGSAFEHKFNLKDPQATNAAFRLVFTGGWTHSSNGAKPNGTNAYADTFFAPSTHLTLNASSIGYYSGTNLAETSGDPINLGSFNTITESFLIRKTNANIDSRNNGALTTYATAVMKGFFVSSKQSSTVTDVYLDGTQQATSNSGGTLPSIECQIGTCQLSTGPYASGWVVNDFRFVFFGDDLSDSEVANLTTAVQAFQTTLSRNV